MARPIDEKIVVMKMDNSDLVQKASETTTLFGKLKDSLNKIPGVNLNKTVQEVGSLRNEVNSTSFDKLASSAQMVTSRLSNMGIVGVTALQNITNRAVDAGISIAKSLTFEQVSSGFDEYELKMKSIGTMLANTEWAGSTLDDVKVTLDELNDYADKTIYSFGEMTASIGRFTAAGVTLEDSTVAIKGLGNLAAVSGSDVNQLNTAMYQMSQAMAAGKLNLEDWNSMVNAGMAGKKTQDALVKTAKAMGKNVDLSDGFRNSIQDGWLTSKVFLETMKAFGNDESMTKAATSVRTFSGAMDALKEGIGSGWATTFEHIFGDFEEATVLWTRLSEAVGGWFGKTADARNKLIGDIADGKGFLNLFDGLENSVKPIMQIFDAMGNGFDKVFPPKTADQIIAITESIKSFTAGLTISEGTMTQLTTIFQGGFSVFSTGIEIVKSLGGALMQLIPEGTGGAVLGLLEKVALMAISFNQSVKDGNAVTKTIDGLGKVLSAIGSTVSQTVGSFYDFGSSIMNNVGRALDWLQAKLAPVGAWFKEAFSDFGGDDLLGAGTLAGIIGLVTLFGSKLTGMFDSFGDIAEGIGDTLEGAGDAIKGFAMGIKVANLVAISGALVLLAISLKMLENIKTEDLKKGLTALAVSLGVMMTGLAVISKFNIVGGLGASATIIALATSVTIIAGALRKISDLNPEELKQGIIGLAGIIGTLSVAIIAISKFGGKVKAGSLQLIALATAVVILAQAVEQMAAINPGELKTSITALGVLFTTLAVFLKIVDGVKFGPGSAVGLIAVAGAIHLMVGAINQISAIDTDSLITGLTTIGVILAELAIFSKIAGGPNMLVAGTGIAIIAGALNLMVPPIQELGAMSMEELAKGLGAMAVALLAVAGAGLMASGAIGGAMAITVIAGALNILLIPIQHFANMTWEEIAKGLVGLGASLALVAGAAILLTPAVPAMLGFGTALALMGAAMLAAGAGVALFGAGLAALASMTAVSIAAIISALSLLITGLGTLVVDVVVVIVKLGLALIDGIRDLVPPLVDVVVYLVVKLLETITNYLPRFLELAVLLVVQLVEGIAQYTPVLVNTGVEAIVALINGLAEAIELYGPELISAILNLLGEIILLLVEAVIQVVDALLGWIPGVKAATEAVGNAAEEYLRENFGAEQVGVDKGGEFISGLTQATNGAKTSGIEIGNAAKYGLESVDLSTAGSTAGENFARGILNSKTDVQIAATSLADVADKAIKQRMGIQSPAKETIKSGEDTGEGYSKGIKKKKKAVKKSAEQVANAAKKAFDEKMDEAEYRFKMGEIDSDKYIKEIQKIRNAYSKYPKLVREANLEIKKIEEDAAKKRDELRRKEYTDAKGWIDDRKYYNEISLKEELKAWERIQAKFKKDTQERKDADKEIYRVKNELVKDELNNSKKYIDDKKYYNQLSLEDELKAWERIQAKYKEGTEERKEAEREVYRLKNELRAKEFNDLKDSISNSKYYNELSLKEELEAWEKVQAKYEAGTNERKEADKEVYRLKNELYRSLVDLNEDYSEKIKALDERQVADGLKIMEDYNKAVASEREKALKEELKLEEEHDKAVKSLTEKSMKEEQKLNADYDKERLALTEQSLKEEIKLREDYEKAVEQIQQNRIDGEIALNENYEKVLKDRKSDLVGSFGIFDKPDSKRVNEQTLMKNMKGQVEVLENWGNNIDNLMGRGVDDELIQSLRDMGPKSAQQIEALTRMTDEELEEYSNLWKTKNEWAHNQAVKELEGLKDDTAKQIEDLKVETEKQLDELNKEWQEKNNELQRLTSQAMDELKRDWISKTEDLRRETNAEMESLRRDWQSKTDALRSETEANIDILTDNMVAETTKMKEESAKQLEEYKQEWLKQVKKITGGTKDEFVGLERSMKDIGHDVISGMMEGMGMMEGPLKETARELAESVADTIRDTLQIRSPSKRTTAMGIDSGKGLGLGIGKTMSFVADKSKSLALTAIDTMNDFMSGYEVPEYDAEIHIKAVVDYDGIDPNKLSGGGPVRVVPDLGYSNHMAMAANTKRQNDNNSNGIPPVPKTNDQPKPAIINQELNFYSNQMTPSEVARKNLQSSRQLAMQWGV